MNNEEWKQLQKLKQQFKDADAQEEARKLIPHRRGEPLEGFIMGRE